MARAPRTLPSTAELDAQIAELQAARDAEIARLHERRREAEREEHRLRGQLLMSYLAGSQGPAIQAALGPVVAPRDRYLFGIPDRMDPQDSTSLPAGVSSNGTHPHRDGRT